MKKLLYALKLLLPATAFVLAVIFTAQAQQKTKVIGNRPRSGKANSSFDVVKGNQMGVKMNAGHKPVQLLQLNFDAESYSNDSLPFKVNVYKFTGAGPGENLVSRPILGALTKGKHRVSVDMSRYNVTASGRIMVAIEWIKTLPASNQFALGLFNGGTYYYEDSRWKKFPIAGVDFNVKVRRVDEVK